MKNLPQRQSMGGGRPHENAAIFEASESLMDGQANVMDLARLAGHFTQLVAEVQEQLRTAQRGLMAITAAQPQPQARVA